MVRQTTPEDFEAVQQIHDLLALNIQQLSDKAYKIMVQESGFLLKKQLTKDVFDAYTKGIFIVAEHDGEVVGFLRIEEEPEMSPETNVFWLQKDFEKRYFALPHAYIAGLALLPKYRKHGLAKQMLLLAEQKVREKGVKDLFSFVVLSPVTNTISLLFHEKNGFERVGSTMPRPIFGIEGYQSILYSKLV